MLYFKHHSGMRHDIKLKRVIAKYGLEGYGLYCLIVESITENLSEESPLPTLQEDADDIALFYNGNSAAIREMTHYMVNQGLFDLSEDEMTLFCHRVYKFLDTASTKSPKLRAMIKGYKEQVKLAVTESLGKSVTNLTGFKNDSSYENEGSYPQGDLPGMEPGENDVNHCDVSDNEVVTESHGLSRTNLIEKEEEYYKRKNIKKEKNQDFQIPTIEEIQSYALQIESHVDPSLFFDYYQSRGWLIGKVPMSDWQAAFRNWDRNYRRQQGENFRSSTAPASDHMGVDEEVPEEVIEILRKAGRVKSCQK